MTQRTITYRQKASRFAAALLLASLGMSACSAPSAPAGSGDQSFGTLATNMADYYYPTQSGKTYIYRNTITEYSNTGNQVLSVTQGAYDTLRTLGYQGFDSPEGDPVYAFSVTYRVNAENNDKQAFPLYYVKKGNSNNG